MRRLLFTSCLVIAPSLSLSFSAVGAVEVAPPPVKENEEATLSIDATTNDSGGEIQSEYVANTREILLELRKRTISLVENGKVIKSWPVAIGDPATPTPTGRFKIENKVVNPTYQSTKSGKVNPITGPNGPLGDRWMGFKRQGLNQFGIHGTPNAWSWTVSSQAAVTNGCVRMFHRDVRYLFEQVDVGTPVVVKN